MRTLRNWTCGHAGVALTPAAALRGRLVGAIAFEAGFGDLSYFKRAWRQARALVDDERVVHDIPARIDLDQTIES